MLQWWKNYNFSTTFSKWEKANLYKKCFSSQCNPLSNASKLPLNQTCIEDEDIYKISDIKRHLIFTRPMGTMSYP